jgi:hypothetical protein
MIRSILTSHRNLLLAAMGLLTLLQTAAILVSSLGISGTASALVGGAMVVVGVAYFLVVPFALTFATTRQHMNSPMHVRPRTGWYLGMVLGGIFGLISAMLGLLDAGMRYFLLRAGEEATSSYLAFLILGLVIVLATGAIMGWLGTLAAVSSRKLGN